MNLRITWHSASNAVAWLLTILAIAPYTLPVEIASVLTPWQKVYVLVGGGAARFLLLLFSQPTPPIPNNETTVTTTVSTPVVDPPVKP